MLRPSGGAEAFFQAAGEAGHRVRADPVHDGDEELELERPDLAVVHDLGGLGEVHVADDRGQ